MSLLDLSPKKTILAHFLSIFLIAVFASFGLTYFQLKQFQHQQLVAPDHFVANTPDNSAPNINQSAVLGVATNSLAFGNQSNGSSNGGVLVLNATEKPVVSIGSYEVSGPGTFKLYRVSKDDLLNYLIYRRKTNDNYGGIEKVFSLDTSKLTLEKAFNQDVEPLNNGQSVTKLSLPISGTGIWFLQGQVSDSKVETMIVNTNLGAIVHEGDNQNIFWVQDSNYASVPDVNVDLLNLENSITNVGQLTTDQSGLASNSVNGALDVAGLSRGDDFTLLPVNLYNLNTRATGNNTYSSLFSQRRSGNKSFIFTDRFLYKPGDTVNFKDIIREDDDADYSISSHVYTVTMSDGNKVIWQKTLSLSDAGTIEASIPIPADAKAGYYGLDIKEGDVYLDSTGVQVAQYRKPDVSLSMSTDKMLYLPGETISGEVTAFNFLGQPIKNQEIRYKIYQTKATYTPGDYEHLQFLQHSESYYPDNAPALEGTIMLDDKGKAKLILPATNTTGFRQYWSINIEYLDGASTATNDNIQVLVQPGDFVIDRVDQNSRLVVGEPTNFQMVLNKNKANPDLKNIQVTGTLKVSNGSGGYTVEKSDLKATSDQNGHLTFAITLTKNLSYLFETETHDKQGNLIKGEENLYATEKGDDIQLNKFTITTDKPKYNVGDTAHITVQTNPNVKNVFVSLGRAYSRDHRVLSLANGTASFDATIIEKYQPNIYVEVGSFQASHWITESQDIPVNTVDKQVTVKITPSQQIYGPAESAGFDILATDGLGRPVKTDLAFWIFDKSLLELHGTYFEGIFKKFWDERFLNIKTNFSYQGLTSSGAEGGGGCFVGETEITMADGSQKHLSDVKVGDSVLTYSSIDTKQKVAAKVVNTHHVAVEGYLILNGVLKVTPEHKLLVNDQWKTAGEVTVGDTLLTDQGDEKKVTSIEWVRGKFMVYNLQIEKFHTFFADTIYVHNDKGDLRSVFKDTAYWNPHVTTGDDGKAHVTVVLPDNLTTWVAAAVSANNFTQVGDGKAEFKVTKDVVTRPILPAFLRDGDILKLSSLLFNYTQATEKFAVNATFIGSQFDGQTQEVSIESGDFAQLAWPLTVTGGGTTGVFKVNSRGVNNTSLVDEVTEKLPIYKYGAPQTNYSKAENSAVIPLALNPGTDPAQVAASLQLKTSRYPELKTLLEGMLNGESYSQPGAASVLVAASIYKQNGKELGLVAPATIATKVKTAMDNLKSNQNAQGYWAKPNQAINPEETRFVIEGLLLARQAGLVINQAMLDSAVNYVKNWQPTHPEEQFEQQYIFSLLPGNDFKRTQLKIYDFGEPSLMSRGIIADSRHGFINSTTELQVLQKASYESDRQLAWVDNTEDVGSWVRIAEPTVWATRAMEELQVDPTKIAKSLDYLYRNTSNLSEIDAMQALATVKYYQLTKQVSPNYQYQIFLADQQLQAGQVTSAQQQIAPITIPAGAMNGGSSLRIVQSGLGNLYSQLQQTEFYNGRDVKAQSHNLTLYRRYLSTKKAGEPTKIGDLVLVEFQILQLGEGENNVQIEDYLPSGLVAIDETLDNGNFDPNLPRSTALQATQEITPQGMKLNFNRILTKTTADTGIYTYKTRVISEGTFDAPPATVSLVNDPTIWASTEPSKLVVDGKNALDTNKGLSNLNPLATPTRITGTRLLLYLGLAIALIALILGSMVAYLKGYRPQSVLTKIRSRFSRKPPEPPITPTPPIVLSPEPIAPVSPELPAASPELPNDQEPPQPTPAG